MVRYHTYKGQAALEEAQHEVVRLRKQFPKKKFRYRRSYVPAGTELNHYFYSIQEHRFLWFWTEVCQTTESWYA